MRIKWNKAHSHVQLSLSSESRTKKREKKSREEKRNRSECSRLGTACLLAHLGVLNLYVVSAAGSNEREREGRKERRAQGERETDNGRDISLVVRSKNRVGSARPLRYAHRSHRDSLLRASRKGLQVAKAASLRRVYSPTRILMIPGNITRKGLRRRRPQTTEENSTVSRTRKSSLSLITVNDT